MGYTKLQKLYSRFKKYDVIPFHIIKLINASILFGNGLMSEYSYQTIFKEKYNVSYSPKQIIKFLKTFSDIYGFVIGEDIPIDQAFIYFLDKDLEKKIRKDLKEEIAEVIPLIYLDYEKYSFSKTQYNIFYALRCRCLIASSPEFLFQNLLNKSDAFLGCYEGEAYTDETKTKTYYVEVDILYDEIKKYIELDNDDYLNRAMRLIDLIDNDFSNEKVSRFIIKQLNHAYSSLGEDYNAVRQIVLTSLYDKWKENNYYLASSNEEELKLVIKLLESLLEIAYLDASQKDILKSAYIKLKDKKADVDYKFLVYMTKTMKQINPNYAEELIGKFFTFSSREELLSFVIKNHLIHCLNDVDQVVKMLDA